MLKTERLKELEKDGVEGGETKRRERERERERETISLVISGHGS
jgi:hypothetical protein